MEELKTKKNSGSVFDFLKTVKDAGIINDCKILSDIMKEITGENPAMWGKRIVGFGSFHYKYDSGREGDWFLTGFSPAKNNLTVYIMSYIDETDDLYKKLGKFKNGKSCLYIKKLKDVDLTILKKIFKKSISSVKKKYPA